MKYLKFDVSSLAQNTIKNEIYFNIASARANGYEFVIIDFKTSNIEKSRNIASKILKAMNVDGRVKLFINANGFDGVSKEELYFRNKYPSMKEICEENREALIVKL